MAMLRRRPSPVPPGPGQESVWDYPRPPRIERRTRLVEVRFGEVLIGRTTNPLRGCETASPPVYYLPPEDVELGLLRPGYGHSTCEWKGPAAYWTVVVGDKRLDNAGWSYPEPWEGSEALAGHFSFYPALLDCRVDGERARPQEGGFYGGWVTDEVVGPWKGEPGTGHW